MRHLSYFGAMADSIYSRSHSLDSLINSWELLAPVQELFVVAAATRMRPPFMPLPHCIALK